MGFCLEVCGEFACFTRPELKVERVSYEVMTPSAARSIFEAILWKPAIHWTVTKIEVLKPIRWINIKRNELGNKIPAQKAKTVMNTLNGCLGTYVEDNRQQRAGMFLKDVRYRLYAEFQMTDKAGSDDNEAKFAEMFHRRATKGQCIYQPYLGCREFPCAFTLQETITPPPAIPLTKDLGWMFYDWDYKTPTTPTPRFFHAQLQDGVLQIPPFDSDEVKG